ncbi:E3 ubiquitin-protein ligase PDZRN3 [Psilocybe cubensis]|nr:E3 ubiquitin-protein ligase PDZRN3 [Psilocybe cubensis]KAH9485102.1 E3 ubiquitin-protein ligase PDZRN3 [Psilocybe cubensis]
MVDELVVECVYSGEGCGYTCERQRMVGHLKEECEYAEVECALAGCGEVMRRRDVLEHVEKMHKSVEEEDGQDVEDNEENARSREDKGKGKEEERCPHGEMGCAFKGEGVEAHLETCVYEQLKGFLSANTARVAALTEQNVMLRHRVEMLEGTVERTRREVSGVKNVVGGLSGGTLEGTLEGLREEVLGLGVLVEEVRRRNEMALTNETLRLSEEMMSIRGQMHGLRMQMHGMMMERDAYTRPMTGSITKL